MKESVAIAKEADAKKEFSSTRSDNSIHRVRDEPERQLSSLRDVIGNIRRDGGTPSVESIATQLSSMHATQRAPALLALQQTHGNRYVQRVVSGIQAKLVVGQPGDKYEQEADRVAEQVMQMPVHANNSPTEFCDANQTKIIPYGTKQSDIGSFGVPNSIAKDINRVSGLNGKPMPLATRAFMERRFDTQFGDVRIHTDNQSAIAARAISAKAFTIGPDVVFSNNAFQPETDHGRRLLAHELVHVIQQRQDGERIQRYDETTEPASRVGEVAADVGSILSPGLGAGRVLSAAVCLNRLFGPMGTLTFNRWIPNACTRSSTGFLHSREWDAFGHCWIACEGSRRCGATPTAILGTSRELYRELEDALGSSPHDSLSQDMSNQASGRSFAFEAGTCYALCDQAHSSGQLDLSAPQRTCANCSTYPTSGSEGQCP